MGVATMYFFIAGMGEGHILLALRKKRKHDKCTRLPEIAPTSFKIVLGTKCRQLEVRNR